MMYRMNLINFAKILSTTYAQVGRMSLMLGVRDSVVDTTYALGAEDLVLNELWTEENKRQSHPRCQWW